MVGGWGCSEQSSLAVLGASQRASLEMVPQLIFGHSINQIGHWRSLLGGPCKGSLLTGVSVIRSL